ncbi:hypothetical protein DXG01_010899 [Tephrocybe rancida]|nr:hypothetical protein DXG01_010899 [Tephrocybe rancida]
MEYMCDFCRKAYATPSGLNYHVRTCRVTKKRVGIALENLRDIWSSKRRRLDPELDPDSHLIQTVIQTQAGSSQVVPVDRVEAQAEENVEVFFYIQPASGDFLNPHTGFFEPGAPEFSIYWDKAATRTQNTKEI